MTEETGNLRLELLKKLGGKCTICGETDTRIIHVDHKLGHGYLEKEYFEKKENMLKYYLDNFDTESKYLQPLCFNCNTKKRIENREQRGRPSLEDYLKMVVDTNFGNLDKRLVRIEDFLHDNPQFVPIHDRFIPVFSDYLQLEIKQREILEKKQKLKEKLSNGISNKVLNTVFKNLFIKNQETKTYTNSKYNELSPKIYEFVKNKEGESKQPVDFVYIHAEFIDEGPWSLNDIRETVDHMLKNSLLLQQGNQQFITK